MPNTLRRHWRPLGTMLFVTVGLVVGVSLPARAGIAGTYAIDQEPPAWCVPHAVFLGPARPAALAAARTAVAELEAATGRSWPITTDAAAADVTIDWDLTVRVGASGEVWLQTEGDRYASAQVVLDPATTDAELASVLRRYLEHVAVLGSVAGRGPTPDGRGSCDDPGIAEGETNTLQ